jgi:ribosomal protein S18 acetylase RimI-like enzyme
MIRARPICDDDRRWKGETLRRVWGSTEVARRDQLIDALPLDGFVAVDGDARVGLLTYAERADELEVVTLHAEVEKAGAGTALMDAARARALEMGARRMWLITTNDNVRAFRFYRRWGMELVRIHRDGVERSRALKPSIPTRGFGGVPIRHELEFELLLTATPPVR